MTYNTAMKYKAVIFDMDGTLLDTIGDIAGATNQVLKEEGLPEHTLSDYKQFVGNGARILMKRALPPSKGSDEYIDSLLERFQIVYREKQFDTTDLYEGIGELLARLKVLRIPMAVLSNKPHHLVQEIGAHYFEEGLFSYMEGQKDSVPHKPAPDGALALVSLFHLEPQECLFIGDSSVDMETALNAGMKGVGVSWGFRSVEELKAHGASYIIESPLELLSLLEEA